MKKILSLLALLTIAVTQMWAVDLTALIDFGTNSYSDLVSISYNNADKTTASLVEATLGSASTKASSSAYSVKAASTTYQTKSAYSNISEISFYVSTTDKGKTYVQVDVCPNEDFSEDVTSVQANAVMNGGGLPANVGNNNQYYLETYTFTTTKPSGYVRVIVSEASGSSGKTICVGNIAIKYPEAATTAPTFTTDLSATADVTVGVPETFTVATDNATSYQWYVGGTAVSGATSASYEYTAAAAGDVEIYCAATNSIGTTNSTTCTVTATDPSSAPTITTDLEAAYNVNKGNTLELSIVADGASSYQWYLDNVAIEGATSALYTFTGTTIGTNDIYCAATNSAGTTNSATATITTLGRADCELTNVKFSNGAYGAIGSATYGALTIAVPYMEGDEAPTVEASSVAVSDGATFAIDGNTFTVTAEDGTTTKEFTITPVEMTPLAVTGDVETTTFTDVPSWVFNLYGYDSSKGLKFAKAVDEASNMRIALGNTRQYYFIGAAKSLTLTYTGTARKVNVYVNGTQVITNTNNSELGAIELDESAPCMVMVEAGAGTSGDGGFASYAIEAVPAPTTETITIPSDGVLTYVTTNALDFSSVNGAFTAYVPTGVNTAKKKVNTAEVTSVPAGTALLLKGAAGIYNVNIVASADAPAANIFLVSNGSVTGGDNIFAYSKSALKFKKVADTVTIPAGKCYLTIAGVSGDALDLDFDGEATAVDAIAEASEAETTPVKVIKNGKLYIGNFNVAGQQVK